MQEHKSVLGENRIGKKKHKIKKIKVKPKKLLNSLTTCYILEKVPPEPKDFTKIDLFTTCFIPVTVWLLSVLHT